VWVCCQSAQNRYKLVSKPVGGKHQASLRLLRKQKELYSIALHIAAAVVDRTAV